MTILAYVHKTQIHFIMALQRNQLFSEECFLQALGRENIIECALIFVDQ